MNKQFYVYLYILIALILVFIAYKLYSRKFKKDKEVKEKFYEPYNKCRFVRCTKPSWCRQSDGKCVHN